jgi:hypothetical protein
MSSHRFSFRDLASEVSTKIGPGSSNRAVGPSKPLTAVLSICSGESGAVLPTTMLAVAEALVVASV